MGSGVERQSPSSSLGDLTSWQKLGRSPRVLSVVTAFFPPAVLKASVLQYLKRCVQIDSVMNDESFAVRCMFLGVYTLKTSLQ